MKSRTLYILIISTMITLIAIILIFLFRNGFTGLSVIAGSATCFDSDALNQFSQKGYVKGEYHIIGISPVVNSDDIDYLEEDRCLDNKTLLEYYCEVDPTGNSFRHVEEHNCKKYCLEGECLNESDNDQVPLS